MKFSFFNSSKGVVGIDIGSSAIKVVQIRKEKGQAVLETYGSLALGPYVEGVEVGQHANVNTNTLSEVLSILNKEAKVTAQKAGVAIPFSASLISLIDVPAVNDDKIAQLIPFEARRHIPVSLDDVSIDWFIIPQALLEDERQIFVDETKKPEKKEDKKKVLLIAIHNNELLKYRNVVSKTNLKPSFFEIEIFSSLRSSVYESRKPLLIIDIGARTTKYYIVEHGIIVRSYFINQGGEAITRAIAQTENIPFSEAEKKKRNEGFNITNKDSYSVMKIVVDEIVSEANNLIRDYENRYQKTISRIILTGGGSTMKKLDEEVKQKTSISVEIANPFGRIRHPEILSETLRENGAEFTVAVGAALRALEG